MTNIKSTEVKTVKGALGLLSECLMNIEMERIEKGCIKGADIEFVGNVVDTIRYALHDEADINLKQYAESTVQKKESARDGMTMDEAVNVLFELLDGMEYSIDNGYEIDGKSVEVARDVLEDINATLPFRLDWPLRKPGQRTPLAPVVFIPREVLENWSKLAAAQARMLELLQQASQQGGAWFEGHVQATVEASEALNEGLASFLIKEPFNE